MAPNSGWLRGDDVRVGLGCMRLSTEPERDEARGVATVHAALDAGATVFDTARAYGLDDADLGHNERLVGRALAAHPRGGAARVVTKGGMRRPGGKWVPDGRAGALRADAEASLAALGRPIDLNLLHAPDPRVPWATSVRALAALVDAGLVRAVGVSNVSRKLLDEAVGLAPIAAVEVALGAFDDAPWRNGVLDRCVALGLTVLAHAPLGGPTRAGRLRLEGPEGASPQQVALARLLAVHPCIVVLPGARRPETARAAVEAASLRLSPLFAARPAAPPPRDDGAEVVLIIGIQGAGKSTSVAAWEARGYERLNRDERGGTLRGLHRVLDERLAAGVRRFVLDNTYLERAPRRDVVDVAWKHGLPVRCVWLDTPAAEAQRNVVARMLAAHGRLLEPAEMKNANEPTRLPPMAFLRALRELEPPAADEGFASIDVVPFVRRPAGEGARGARFVALEAVAAGALVEADGATLVFAWQPGGAAPPALPGGVAFAACTHPAGPPTCWCRPPLPGLLVAFAAARGLDLGASVVVGTTAAHRALAEAAGARHEAFAPE